MEQLVELSEKLEKEEKEKKNQLDSLIAEESTFRGQMLVQQERTINSLENLAETIHQESQRRAQEHRELLQALLGLQRFGGSTSSG